MRSTSLLVVIMLIVVLLAHDTHNMFAQSRLFPGGDSSNPLKTAAGVIATMLFATMVVTGGMQKTQRPIANVAQGGGRAGTSIKNPIAPIAQQESDMPTFFGRLDTDRPMQPRTRREASKALKKAAQEDYWDYMPQQNITQHL